MTHSTILTIILVWNTSASNAQDAIAAPKNTIVIEAEAAMSVQPPFRPLADKDCNGETCLTVPQGVGKPPEILGRVRFTVPVVAAGEYKLWVRAHWMDHDGNSIGFFFEGREPDTVGQGGIYGRWHWVPGPVIKLAAGNQTFYMFNREDGVSIDRLLLVPDANYLPRGKEGIKVPTGWAARDFYFADDFSRSAEQPVKEWREKSGHWKVNHTLDPNKLPNFFSYTGKAETTGLATTGHRFWKDYSFEAAVRPQGCESVGLAFSLVDDDHYLLIRWLKSNKMELCRIAGGKETVLKQVDALRMDDTWWRFGVTTRGNSVEVQIDGSIVMSEEASVSGGKVGLYVARGTAAFDNVEVLPVRRFTGGPIEQPALWKLHSGKWAADNAGVFTGNGDKATAVTGEQDWSDCVVTTSVKTDKSFRVLSCWTSPKSYYAFEFKNGKYSLIRVQDGKESVLDSATAAGARDWKLVSFRRVGAYLSGSVGTKRLVEAWDDALTNGHTGLMTGAAGVAFREFSVEFLRPDDQSRTIESVRFLTDKVVDPTDVPDLTPEQYERTVNSAESAVLMRRPKYYHVIGRNRSSCLWWASTKGVWSVENEQLLARPAGSAGAVFCNRHAPNDAGVSAKVILRESTGSLGVILHGVREDISLGHRLVIEGSGTARQLNLYSGAQRVASIALTEVPAESTIQLWRSGDHVLGWFNGKLLLKHKATRFPEGEEAGLYAAGSGGEFVSVKLLSLNYRGAKSFYLFDRPVPDWLPVAGKFEVHGGISCLRSSHWLTMLGEKAPALAWLKKTLKGNSSISYQAMEHSVWYGWNQQPSHTHTAYVNMGMSLHAKGPDISTGYAAIINGWNHKRCLLLKNGKVVAQAVIDENFPVQWVGAHAPLSPRTSVMRLTLVDGLVVARINGIPVLTYKDSVPLKEGWAGLWNWDARINLGDVHVTCDEFSPIPLSAQKAARNAGSESVARVVKSLN